jgi:hypothetical protein
VARRFSATLHGLMTAVDHARMPPKIAWRDQTRAAVGPDTGSNTKASSVHYTPADGVRRESWRTGWMARLRQLRAEAEFRIRLRDGIDIFR